MKNLLTEIAKRLVDNPEQVNVGERGSSHTLVLFLISSRLTGICETAFIYISVTKRLSVV